MQKIPSKLAGKYLVLVLWLHSISVFGTDIYTNGVSILTGTWDANGQLQEINTDQPFDGNEHLRFQFNFTEYWSGFGLNMDNWYSGPPIDFSGFTHLRLAYRGLNAETIASLRLRSGTENYGPWFELGGAVSEYIVVDIPLAFLSGSLDLSAISEINFQVTGLQPVSSGSLFLDGIRLVNAGSSAIGSASWPLLQSFGQGINMSNWLEAYWLIPWGAFPESNKYTRAHFEFFQQVGFKTVRLPVTFENLQGSAPNYTLDLNHEVFRLIDSVLVWVEDYSLNLIITNHHGLPLTSENWQDELPRHISLWQQLLGLYGHLSPNKVLFELYNEPTLSIYNTNLRLFFVELVHEFRLLSLHHTVIIGANSWNSGEALLSFSPLEDQRVIYTFHSYEPYAFTHQGMSWTSPAYMPQRSFPLAGEESWIRDIFSAVSHWSEIYDVPVF